MKRNILIACLIFVVCTPLYMLALAGAGGFTVKTLLNGAGLSFTTTLILFFFAFRARRAKQQ